MKKLVYLSFLVLASTMLVLTLNNCNKVPIVNQNAETEDNSNSTLNSEAMLEHILAFKEKMKYYKEHPGLKSSEKEQVDETVIDWESDINLTYCYSYLDLSDAVTYDTVLVLPPIVQDSILMADISAKYYDEIIYAVQEKYFQAPFADSLKKLMVVDLEKTSGGDSLQIKTLIGNSQPPNYTTAYNWKYGNKLGTCDEQYYVGERDAAMVCADNTRTYFKEDPPTGCRWFFYGPLTTIIVRDPTQHPNPNDPPPVNYEDYMVYYANSADGAITDQVLCLEFVGELGFYKQSYINLTQDWISASGGKKFKECIYAGIHLMTNNSIHIYKHELSTTLGYRGVDCDTVIDNIAEY